jgi:uncharacterized small protein (DUF1192 family)
MDFLTKQSLRQQLAILEAKKYELECEIVMLTKEIERLKDEIGDEL